MHTLCCVLLHTQAQLARVLLVIQPAEAVKENFGAESSSETLPAFVHHISK